MRFLVLNQSKSPFEKAFTVCPEPLNATERFRGTSARPAPQEEASWLRRRQTRVAAGCCRAKGPGRQTPKSRPTWADVWLENMSEIVWKDYGNFEWKDGGLEMCDSYRCRSCCSLVRWCSFITPFSGSFQFCPSTVNLYHPFNAARKKGNLQFITCVATYTFLIRWIQTQL